MADLYQTITDAVIAQLEKAQGNWAKPWINCNHIPTSQATGQPYRGMNTFLLMLEGRADHRWGTYVTWKKLGCQVRKGEKSTLIAQPIQITREKEGKSGETETQVFNRYKGLRVFNAEQVDGVAEIEVQELTETQRLENAEEFIAGTGAKIEFGQDAAAYSPMADRITCPDPDAFHTTQGYYSTLLHELGHWSGHKTRCNRELMNHFGTPEYAFEELVAELSSAYLCGLLGIEQTPREDHAEYLAHWLTRLKKDKNAFPNAAKLAQQACDFLQSTQAAEQAA